MPSFGIFERKGMREFFCDSAYSLQDILKSVLLKIGKWAIKRNEFVSFSLDNILFFNWEGC